MKKNIKNLVKNAILVILGLILTVSVISFGWLLKPGLSDYKLSVLRIIPIPLFVINGEPLFSQNFFEGKTLASAKFNKTNAEVYGALLENYKIKAVAKKLGLTPVLEKDNNLLSEFEAYKNALKIYYNTNESLNSSTYKQANEVLNKLKNGQSFALLAKQYSQDEFSKNLGGYVNKKSENVFLPEIEKALNEAHQSATILVASRYGLHILEADLQGSGSSQIKQIYFETSGFEDWLVEQINLIKTKIIIKP